MNGRGDDGLEALLPRLSELAARPAAEAAPCPDELQLAGYAEERLLPGERDALETHLASCSRCRESVAALARENAAPADPEEAPRPAVERGRAPTLLRFAPLLAAAAALLLALGWWMARAPPRTTLTLAVAARELATADPVQFAGFLPLSPEELCADPRPVLRASRPRGLTPRGVVDEARPRIEWEPVRLAERYEVSIVDEGGALRLQWSGAQAGLDWPADAAPLPRDAACVVTVVASGPLGETRASASFRVAGEAESQAAAAAEATIGRVVDPPLRDLFAAHWLLRGDRPGQAAAAARRFLVARPEDPAGRLALFQALARLDASEADALAPGER